MKGLKKEKIIVMVIYKRRLETRVGNIVLQIPRFRYGKFTTDLFQRYQRSEQALLLALMEMVVNGVSTRKIEEITYELCGSEFSRIHYI